MDPVEPDRADSIGWTKRGAEAAALLAGLGILAQGASYLAANSFYSELGLQADQLGVTPLNALLRLNLTSVVAAMLLATVAFVVSLILSWRSIRAQRGRHRDSGDKKLLPIPMPSALQLAVAVAVAAVSVSQLLMLAGQDAGASVKVSRTPGVNPISLDLYPQPGFLRWTKNEEFPELLFDDTSAPNANFRAVSYLGTQNGVSYFLDWDTHGTIVAPASQVQMLIATPGTDLTHG